MRKVFVLLFMVIIEMLCVSARAEFVLPASLTAIEEEAFAGTAAQSVVMQEAVVTLGDYAFAYMPALRIVTIPESVSWIGDSVFSSKESIIICGTGGSYAEIWARDHGFSFACLPAPAGSTGLLSLLVFLLIGGTLCPAIQMLTGNRDQKYAMVNGEIKVLRWYSELYPVLYDFP